MDEPEGLGAVAAGSRATGAATTTAAVAERGEPCGVVIAKGSAWAGDRHALAALLYEGYAQKAVALRVDRETALTALAGALNLDRCFVAVKDGSVVGIVGLVEGDGRALHFSLALVRRHFGLLRSLAYFLALNIRTWGQPAPGELAFEALAVSPEHRKRGIGRRLVEEVEEVARARGYGSVGLEVTDSNHAAISLYTRMGYAIAKTRRYAFATRRAGFGGSRQMRKLLSRTPCLY